MLKWFGNQTDSGSSADQESKSATIRVIGDRASGKTTYMASLARWPNADPDSPVQSVSPFNEDGESLITQAQMVLEQGLPLAPSSVRDDMPDYAVKIALKGQFSWRGSKQKTINLIVNCKDYAGEFFSDLLHKANDPLLQDYLEDCLLASGILLLLDGNSYRKDAEYAYSLDRFLMALDAAGAALEQRRIALVLTKCEQPELWINRFNPQQIAVKRFPQVYKKLSAWQQTGTGKVEYFATSAFGTLGSRLPEPNAIVRHRDQRGTASVLKDPRRWRPFGLVSPIYWLCTGERNKDLDKD